jgi:hypothetical protein
VHAVVLDQLVPVREGLDDGHSSIVHSVRTNGA